jgi:hypothetical protein
VRFQVLMIGDGIDEADDVFAGLGIEAIYEDGVGGVVIADEFEFGIVEDQVAVIFDADGAADLKDDFRFVCGGFHEGSCLADDGLDVMGGKREQRVGG